MFPFTALVAGWFLIESLLKRFQPGETARWRVAFLYAVIAWGILIGLSSEALGQLGLLRREWLGGFWLVVFLVASFGIWWLRRTEIQRRSPAPSLTDGPFNITREKAADYGLFFGLIFYVVVLYVIAIIAPPNTNDSLQYHMSRVMHWAQQGSLAFYPTPIERQLWMPPWAELGALHLLLTGGDWAVNLVQWLCMVSSLIVGSLIASRLGAKRGGQILAAVACVTIPMGMLQATSTQTDYATALWLLALAYFAVTAHQRPLTTLEWLAAGAAVGLGALTKGSFYPFALPLLAWMGLVTLRRGWKMTVKAAVLGALMVVLLNAGVWGRNWQAFGSPFGPPADVASLSNEKFGPGVLVSNLLRNLTLHLGTPYGVINGPVREAVEGTLHLIGEDANDPLTTLSENPYRVRRSRHEDSAGNPLHLGLFVLAGVMLILAGRAKSISPYTNGEQISAARWLWIALALGFLIFSSLYKWQSTGSRLQLPFFVAAMPLAGLALERLPWKWLRTAAGIILLISGLSLLFDNPSRALWPSEGSAGLLTQPRQEVLFANSPEVMPGYLSIIEAAKSTGCREIGLMLDSHDPEYPFWALLSPSGQEVRLEHMVGENLKSFQPCAVICTICSEPEMFGLPFHSNHFGGFILYANP